MLRGRVGAVVPPLTVTPRHGDGGTSFQATAGRVTGVYGDGARDLALALGGRLGSGWRLNSGPGASPAATVPATEHTVWHLLAAVAGQFSHRSPTRAAAAVADVTGLGDLRARPVTTLGERDRRCLAIAAAALTGARFVVMDAIDDGLTSREVAVVAHAGAGCAGAFTLGFVFGVTTTRNAFWADDVWCVDACCRAERVSAIAQPSLPGAAHLA